ncbi:hypothetical protein [Rhodoplanes sp. Z2-YC6860]|uniref:hypothetical protein n=1 Tax=Rhodoplanes sp. Z2-YC6860 TaxID=674703 RepID=UPI0012EE2321|nr:hypothetical protein [Rhodoplanes sp. Z2-YC6860]
MRESDGMAVERYNQDDAETRQLADETHNPGEGKIARAFGSRGAAEGYLGSADEGESEQAGARRIRKLIATSPHCEQA